MSTIIRSSNARPTAPVEIVEIEVALTRPGPRLPAFPAPRRTGRDARIGKGVWRRERLGRDFVQKGPCLVLEYGATTYVPQGWRARVDQLANLRLERT